MSAAKILWGQVLAVVLIILMSVWAATQWTASALGYQPDENTGIKKGHSLSDTPGIKRGQSC